MAALCETVYTNAHFEPYCPHRCRADRRFVRSRPQRQGLVRTVTGIDTDRDNLERALERGVINRASVVIDADSIGGADLVLIATPVATVPAVLTALRPVLPEHT